MRGLALAVLLILGLSSGAVAERKHERESEWPYDFPDTPPVGWAQAALRRVRARKHTDVELGKALYQLSVSSYANPVEMGKYLDQAMALPRYRASREWAATLPNAANLMRIHDPARAEPLYRELLQRVRANAPSDPSHEALFTALDELGQTYVVLQRGRDAATVLDEALALLDSSPELTRVVPWRRGTTQFWRAQAAALVGDGAQAMAFIERAEAAIGPHPSRRGFEVLVTAAEIHRQFGRPDQAMVSARAARDWVDAAIADRQRSHSSAEDLLGERKRLAPFGL